MTSHDSQENAPRTAFLPHDESLAPPGRVFGVNDSAVYRTLFESTKAIPWKIDWATMENRPGRPHRPAPGRFASDIRRTLIAGEAIARARSPHNQLVTASFGVGTIVPTERMEPTAFINLIDAKLYQAKENGRNRIAAIDHAGIRGEAFKSHSR